MNTRIRTLQASALEALNGILIELDATIEREDEARAHEPGHVDATEILLEQVRKLPDKLHETLMEHGAFIPGSIMERIHDAKLRFYQATTALHHGGFVDGKFAEEHAHLGLALLRDAVAAFWREFE